MGYLRVLVVLVLVVGMVVVGFLKGLWVVDGSCLVFRLVCSIVRVCRCIHCIGSCLRRGHSDGHRVEVEIDLHFCGHYVHDSHCFYFFALYLDHLVRDVCGIPI